MQNMVVSFRWGVGSWPLTLQTFQGYVKDNFIAPIWSIVNAIIPVDKIGHALGKKGKQSDEDKDDDDEFVEVTSKCCHHLQCVVSWSHSDVDVCMTCCL